LEARVGVQELAIVNESTTILATPKRDTCPETGADIVVGEMVCSQTANELVTEVRMSFISSYCESA